MTAHGGDFSGSEAVDYLSKSVLVSKSFHLFQMGLEPVASSSHSCLSVFIRHKTGENVFETNGLSNCMFQNEFFYHLLHSEHRLVTYRAVVFLCKSVSVHSRAVS